MATYVYGVVRDGSHSDVSQTLRGAKTYATRHGYHIVSRRNVNSYNVEVMAVKNAIGRWEAQ